MYLSAEQCKTRLRWTGRTLFDQAHGAVFFNWTCAGFTVRFYGTRLALELIAFAAGYLYLEGRKLKKQTTQTPNNFDEKSGAGS